MRGRTPWTRRRSQRRSAEGSGASPAEFNKYCLEFNNGVTNEYVNFGNILQLAPTAPFTFSAWVKVTSTGNRVVLGRRSSTDTNNPGYAMQVNSDNQTRVDLCGDGGSDSLALIAGEVVNDAWKHMAFSWDGTDSLRQWVNGSLEGGPDTHTFGGTWVNTATFAIGSRAGNEEFQVFKGRIKDVAYFNVGMTSVTSLYNGGKPGNLTGTTGLVKWYRLGDGGDRAAGGIINQVTGAVEGTYVNMDASNFVMDTP